MDLLSQAGGERRHPSLSPRLWLRLIGEFEARTEGGRSVLPVSKKARALLALVAAHTPQTIRRDLAAALLWSGKPRDQAANSLRQALRELQLSLAACGEPVVLQAGGGRLSLQTEGVWIDIQDAAAIKWRPAGDGAVGPSLLCQNLQGLDPAFDAHLERIWKNLVFQQAFTAPANGDEQAPVAQPGFSNHQVLDLLHNAGSPVAAGLLGDTGDVPLGPSKIDGLLHGQGWRIAVLPFRSLGVPLEGGLSLGMAEEVSAALARFRMPRVIATGSFWDGAGPAADALARCRAFGLDYVISGTIQVSGERIRVTVSLLDVGMEFELIWAQRFHGTTQDLFTLQDTIASQTVAQIDPELLVRHQSRREPVETAVAAAHHAVLTALQCIYHPDRERFLEARPMLLKAIELDPDYAAAHAWLAYWYILAISQDWIDNPVEAATRAGLAAERAIGLDPLDARGVTIAGHVKAYLLHDIDAALVLHQRAINLNPNLTIAWMLSSWAHVYAGQHRTALTHAGVAEALSPNDPHVFIAEHAAMSAHLLLGNLQVAETVAASVLERRPRHAGALRIRISILGHMGRQADARICLAQLLEVSNGVAVPSVLARTPFRPADLAFYAAGLRLAGLEG